MLIRDQQAPTVLFLLSNVVGLLCFHGRFIIDIVSGFPLDLVLQDGNGAAQGTQLAKLTKIGRVVRMFKLVRLLRVARVARVVGRLEYTMSTQEALRTLWKFFIVVLLCCHFFTCLFYAIGQECGR